MRSIPRALLVTAVAVALLSGCTVGGGASNTGLSNEPGASDTAVPSVTAPSGHPADLVGMWRVTDALGGAGDSWLRVDNLTATLWRECGVVEGSWRAAATLFAMDLQMSYGEGCRAPGDTSVPWLERAVGFIADGDDVRLLDGAGDAVATLVADSSGELPAADPVSGVMNTPPTLTPEIRASLEPGRVIPAGIEPATDLVGRWGVAEEAVFVQEQPYVEFFADGRYIGSDGCNGGAGRWALGADGSFIATQGAQTLMGCGGSDVPSWVAQAASVGAGIGETDAPELTLFDADGLPIATLVGG